MMSRKKALDDVEQGQESFCCLLSAWVSVDSISLTHARLAGFGWTTFPWYAKPMHLFYLMCCADHVCFSCAPAGCIG
jgi:hypothetical protein